MMSVDRAIVGRLRHFIAMGTAVAVTMATASTGFAANELDYPELQVVPLASERIQQEAQRDGSIFSHWPIQISALSTITTGLFFAPVARNKGLFELTFVPIGVGAAWIAGTLALSKFYHPYDSGLEEIKHMPARTTRERLARERAAERVIERAASMGRRLSVLSTVTQLAANGTALYMTFKEDMGHPAFALSAAGAVLSFMPLLFKYEWQHVANEQKSYKKRIYGPVASFTLFDEKTPGVSLAFRF